VTIAKPKSPNAVGLAMASLTFCVSAALICQSPDKKLLKKIDALAVGAPAATLQQRFLSNQREKDI
jgi:hypothetical protein